MTTSPPPVQAAKYRKPDTGPTASEVDDQQLWEKISTTSLTSVQAAAEKWRTGLAAFVTLVTGGLLIKGPDAAAKLPTGWLLALTLLAASGLLAAVSGLWLALLAAAGSPSRLNLAAVVAKYGGVRQFEIACAETASANLRRARNLVGISLLLLGAAVITWWWAPVQSDDPPALIRIDDGGKGACGELLSADNGKLRVQVDGEEHPRSVPFASVKNVYVTPKC